MIAVYVNNENNALYAFLKKETYVFRFGFAFCCKFQFWNSLENIPLLQQNICIVPVLEVTSLREVDFFVLTSNILLKLHLSTQTMEQDLQKEVSQITQRYQLKLFFARNLVYKWFKMKKKVLNGVKLIAFYAFVKSLVNFFDLI